MKRRKPKRKFIALIILILVVSGITLAYAIDTLQDGTRVEPLSELIYYIDVNYDGKDIEGVESSDKTTAEINSDIINVEDKLPEGLTFKEFVTTTNKTIGATKRSDNTVCSGYVIGGVDGLKYDEATRKITFQVKGLGAGCKLTVGIKTTTPTVDDPTTPEVETRRDFYNTANANEGMLSVNSNTVHAYIGNPSASLHQVTYEFTGEVPENAILPKEMLYAENQEVGIENAPLVEGYEFSGWTSEDVTIENNKFKMPTKNITLKGSFTKKSTLSVNYEIEGTIPNGYIIPDKKEYYENNQVKVDSLQIGEEINGYRFLGWTSEDVAISEENDFLMPNKNVVIKGKFEEIKYNVIYKFQGNIIPENSENLLPKTKAYKANSKVKLENVTSPKGYIFLGWYKEDDFEMPDHDVTIYGEWGLQNGLFEPTIAKEIINKKTVYKQGDKVSFKITITNNETYSIKDIIINEKYENVTYVKNENYQLLTDKMIRIEELGPKKKYRNICRIYSKTNR